MHFKSRSCVTSCPAPELTTGLTKIFTILLQFGSCSGAVEWILHSCTEVGLGVSFQCDTARQRHGNVSHCCITVAHSNNGRTFYNSRKDKNVGVKLDIGVAKKPCQLASLQPSWTWKSRTKFGFSFNS